MKVENHSKEAIKAAEKICCYGRCNEKCFDCGHKKADFPGDIPKMGKMETCPLQEYNLEDKKETRNWWEIPADEDVCIEDIWKLCEECPHTEVVEEGDELVIKRVKFNEMCIDCPVMSIGDCILETQAEGSCS